MTGNGADNMSRYLCWNKKSPVCLPAVICFNPL